jgi:hypothetical protein
VPDLTTVDLDAVEVMAAGGPVHGIGSPPEGDHWTPKQLAGIADANRDLAGELRPPAKIGHGGDQPAVGWLENVRVSDDGNKLLADVKRVPERLAELIKVGAYRARSAELSKVTSQKTGKTYDWALSGLAFLGGRVPAVKTLDDIVALYEGDADAELRYVVEYENDARQWVEQLAETILRAFAISTTDKPWDGSPARFTDEQYARSCLLDRGGDAPPKQRCSLPVREPDGTVNVNAVRAAASALGGGRGGVKAPAEAIAAARRKLDSLKAQVGVGERSNEDDPGSRRGRADTRAMPKFSEEQHRAFAEATGLEPDTITDEMLGAAGVVSESDEPKPDEPAADESKPDDEPSRALEQANEIARSAEERVRKLEEELRIDRRRLFVETAIKDGKVAPGQRETLESLYDANAESARKFMDEAPVNEELTREYGSDAPPSADEAEAEEQRYLEDASVRLGIPKEELV